MILKHHFLAGINTATPPAQLGVKGGTAGTDDPAVLSGRSGSSAADGAGLHQLPLMQVRQCVCVCLLLEFMLATQQF